MNKSRDMNAENVGSILSSASAQQISGLLKVERTQESRTEKGELYILAGQPTYARTGKLNGQPALEHLLTWHNVHFTFNIDAPRPPANLSSQTKALPAPSLLNAQSLSPTRLPAIREESQQTPTERLIPRKIQTEQYALSLSLAHRQRLMYFLINDQRTIADLARCSGKTAVEVESILRELHQLGLIAISKPS